MATKVIAVCGRGDEKTIDAYLYGHTARAITVVEGGKVFTFCVTTVESAFDGDNEGEAQHLADYQAGRLQSGLFFARVFDNIGEALKDADVRYVLNDTSKGLFAQLTKVVTS